MNDMIDAGMIYKKLELTDMDAAAVVHRGALLGAMPMFEGLHTPEEDRRYFREIVFQTCEVWGAFDESCLIGIIAFREDWIDQLYVLPGVQRRGIGTGLLAIARSAFSELYAWTFQRNTIARNFYESRGFTKIKETDGADNEEREPDALYFWSRKGTPDAIQTTQNPKNCDKTAE
jgi:GNAT superfamily N-acetyltransferase